MPRPSHSSRFSYLNSIGWRYSLLSSTLRSFLHSPVTLSFLGTNIPFYNVCVVNILTKYFSYTWKIWYLICKNEMSFLLFAMFIVFSNIITLTKWWIYEADTFSYAKDIKILFVSKWLLVSLLLLFYRLNTAVTARSMACTCRSSLAGVEESNSAGTRKFVSYECCVLSCRGLH
jgi:hypothetical protein